MYRYIHTSLSPSLSLSLFLPLVSAAIVTIACGAKCGLDPFHT